MPSSHPNKAAFPVFEPGRPCAPERAADSVEVARPAFPFPARAVAKSARVLPKLGSNHPARLARAPVVLAAMNGAAVGPLPEVMTPAFQLIADLAREQVDGFVSRFAQLLAQSPLVVRRRERLDLNPPDTFEVEVWQVRAVGKPKTLPFVTPFQPQGVKEHRPPGLQPGAEPVALVARFDGRNRSHAANSKRDICGTLRLADVAPFDAFATRSQELPGGAGGCLGAHEINLRKMAPGLDANRNETGSS